MRTNIELDDDLVREARKLSRAKTKKGLIEEALVTYIEVETARRQRETYAERLQSLQAKLSEVRLRETPAKLLRQDRSR
jgi:Arc/MetJ family transcription regulator